jgi:hypothetical protein
VRGASAPPQLSQASKPSLLLPVVARVLAALLPCRMGAVPTWLLLDTLLPLLLRCAGAAAAAAAAAASVLR